MVFNFPVTDMNQENIKKLFNEIDLKDVNYLFHRYKNKIYHFDKKLF